MNYPYIINIQKYSVHDGDGIRTTIFFKGCHLRCWWCHNPESQNYKPEFMFDRAKCTGCGFCVRACKKGAIQIIDGKAVTDPKKCTLCGECFDYCVQEARQKVGRTYKIDELVKICEKDQIFYEQSGGGVTLSGGEVMSQDIDYLEELCKQLKKKGFNVAMDTCGHAPIKNYERLLPYVDTWLYDVKVIDDAKHKKYIGKTNETVLRNLKFIAQHGANINIRIPVVEPVNNDERSMLDIIEFLEKNVGICKVNLLPYHSTGSSKYARLGRPYLAKDLKVPSKENMEALKQLFQNHGFKRVKIGG